VIGDGSLAPRDVDLIYVSVTGTGNELNYEMFVICLFEVAARKYKQKLKIERKEEAMKLLCVR
jgi:hypothetical protein